MTMMASILMWGFPFLMIWAGWRDMVSYTIPNWISISLIALFIPVAILAQLPWADVGVHFAVGLGALILTMIMFALRWIGGGDAKLFAAGALWMGWPHVLVFVLVSAVAGGILTLLLIFLRKAPLPAVFYRPKWAAALLRKDGDIPYGIALCAGALYVFPQTLIVAHAIS